MTLADAFDRLIRAEAQAAAGDVVQFARIPGAPGYERILEGLPVRPAWERQVSVLSAERAITEAEFALTRLLLRPDVSPLALEEYAAAQPATKEDIIAEAMRAREMLEFSYTPKWGPRAGVPGSYAVEPYEFSFHPASGRPVLYAYHPEHGEIHSFLWERIHAPVAIEGATFTPRWPVQPDSLDRA